MYATTLQSAFLLDLLQLWGLGMTVTKATVVREAAISALANLEATAVAMALGVER